jgi:hypothetical protein
VTAPKPDPPRAPWPEGQLHAIVPGHTAGGAEVVILPVSKSVAERWAMARYGINSPWSVLPARVEFDVDARPGAAPKIPRDTGATP